ncbi:hypothetical protein ACFFX0_07980 [Citricoccus parietis]|uniref:Uncharacterized protein n=1 Tax=Citricoccus parietis TaxID=592307 RepID=A0ABV5FWT0_9MICC
MNSPPKSQSLPSRNLAGCPVIPRVSGALQQVTIYVDNVLETGVSHHHPQVSAESDPCRRPSGQACGSGSARKLRAYREVGQVGHSGDVVFELDPHDDADAHVHPPRPGREQLTQPAVDQGQGRPELHGQGHDRHHGEQLLLPVQRGPGLRLGGAEEVLAHPVHGDLAAQHVSPGPLQTERSADLRHAGDEVHHHSGHVHGGRHSPIGTVVALGEEGAIAQQ